MTEEVPFLDTNVLLRHLLGDVPSQSERATAYFGQIAAGEATARTAETVIMETVFTLERTYKIPKARIRDELTALLQLPSLQLPGKRMLVEVFDVYVEHNLSFIDAYHAVMLPRWGMDTILSFDRDFDRIPGIRRIEP